MGQNKWEYRENFHSTGCGDYDGQYEITDGKIFICTADDPEDITENENALQQIARLLNESGCKFYSNNALEIKQYIEIQELGYKIDELQAKFDRYQSLLQVVHQKAKEGIFPHLPVETMGAQKCVEIDAVLNEAISAGDRICPNCNKIFNADRHGHCRECGSDEYTNQLNNGQ